MPENAHLACCKYRDIEHPLDLHQVIHLLTPITDKSSYPEPELRPDSLQPYKWTEDASDIDPRLRKGTTMQQACKIAPRLA